MKLSGNDKKAFSVYNTNVGLGIILKAQKNPFEQVQWQCTYSARGSDADYCDIRAASMIEKLDKLMQHYRD